MVMFVALETLIPSNRMFRRNVPEASVPMKLPCTVLWSAGIGVNEMPL
jgi:hypothetical protein